MTDANSANSTACVDDPVALAELVRDCARKRLPIVDYGVAHGGLGNPPPEPHLRLTQAGGVVEHYERDMTVRVAAGASLGDLQAALTAKRQFLPVDADDDVTVGEAIVHNVYGPLRLTYGSMRDLTLGLRYIDGDGQDVHVGGRTVKNVAGYDVGRFMVGSLGQFGLVYEATVRTHALPEQTATVHVELAEPERLDEVLTDWLLSDAAPTWVDLRQDDRSWRLDVGYYGRSTATDFQLEAMKDLVSDTAGMQLAGVAAGQVMAELSQRQARRCWRRTASAVVKVVVPPASTGLTCLAIAIWSDANQPLTIEAVPTHGCIFAGADLDASAVRGLDKMLAGQLKDVGGSRAWLRRPEGAESIAPFAPPQDDWGVLDRLRRVMDPHGLFNPGRFLPVEATSQ